MAHLTKISSMPALHTAIVDLECKPYISADDRITQGLLPLIDLDHGLPSHCTQKQRQYTVAFKGDLEEVQRQCVIITPLASRSTLKITLICYFNGSSVSSSNIQDNEVPQYCDAKALAASMPDELRQSIHSLRFSFCHGMLSRAHGTADLFLPNLGDLRININTADGKWAAHVLHQLLSSLSAPNLTSFVLWCTYGPHYTDRYVDMLEIFLPTWPKLNNMEFDADYDGEELDLTALMKACETRGVHFEAGGY